MTPFQHTSPAFRTYCGDDALAALPRELERAGARRVVVVCGASLARHADALARVRGALGERCVAVFDGVREHSPVPSVEAGARLLAQSQADGVVAVGGGSAVVTARAASILLAEQQSVRALCTRRLPDGKLVSPKLGAAKLPQWVVASTPTTAYAKAGSALLDAQTGERLALFDPKTRAQALFIDPVLAASAPVALVESASLNALAMAVEGLEASEGNPIAEAQLRHALTLAATWLPRLRAEPADPQVRMQLMLAALLSGFGTDTMGGGAASVLAHATGPRAGVANGLVQAIVLPHVMRFNASVTGERPRRVTHALGTHAADPARPAADQAIEAVGQLFERLGIARRLRDLGVEQALLPQIAAHGIDDWFIERNPRRVTQADAEALLHAAW
jgi:alcohol dehydrogenase class IV